MTHPLTVVLTTVAATGVLVAVAACSSAPTPNTSGGTSGTSNGVLGDDDDDPPPAGGTSSGAPNDAGRTEAGPNEAACLAGPAAACPGCCTEAHAKGSAHYDKSLLKCICTTPAACQAECATTFCATPFQTPNAACNTCIRGAVDGACKTQLETECNAEPDCPALYSCINQCP